MSEYYELYQQCRLERDLLRQEIEELKSLIKEATPYVKENVGNEFMSNRLKEWLEKAEKIKA